MADHHQVMHFLAELRAAVPDAVARFTQGGCFQLHLLLRALDDTAEPWYDADHVITRIGDRFYDITGPVPPGLHQPLSAEPRSHRDAFNWRPQDQAADLAGPCDKDR